MNNYLQIANAGKLYLIVGLVLAFVVGFCIFFLIRSYRAGISMGMDKKILRRAITSSATFTAIPSISTLLGVLALAGSLGVPVAWLRLSVIGNLQYEATVAQIAAEGLGKTLDSAVLNMSDLVTILLIMTIGIIWSCVFTALFLKPYTKKLAGKKNDGSVKKHGPSFSSIAMVAMFIALCSAFIGNYVADFIVYGAEVPILTAIVSAIVMAIFEYLIKKKGHKGLESFSLALSMVIAMAASVGFAQFFGGM
ncbi:MAG: DUF5058 family protein [Sphaerochaetaceae bacterium]|jgi:hypothetical protein|nr:DUF5058 family protein [Sphaerochaetaceae bacterium]